MNRSLSLLACLLSVPCLTLGCQDYKTVAFLDPASPSGTQDSAAALPACTVYVAASSQVGAGDGASWSSAVRTVQEGLALASARAPCEVWVAAGVYPIYSSSPRDTIQLRPGVSVFGGFAGGERARELRDFRVNRTTLDGGQKVYHVVTGSADATLDGFVVTNGSASGEAPDDRGGGMLIEQGAPAVANCVFKGNFATTRGGGVFNEGGDVQFRNCAFVDNRTQGSGGGLFNQLGRASIINGLFHGNASEKDGAGVYNGGGALSIVHCSFSRNQAGGSGDAGGSGVGSSVGAGGATASAGTNGGAGTGGAIYHASGERLEIRNSVLWGDIPQELFSLVATAVQEISHSDVQDGRSGPGNITLDPKFQDALAPDLHLQAGSPCIDAADGSVSVGADFKDQGRFDDPNTVDTGIGNPAFGDLGALEYWP